MDKRLIDKVEDYAFDLEKLKELKPVVYSTKNAPAKSNLGLIAQNVESVEPLLVQRTQGIYTVDYEAFSILLLSTIQQLQQRIEALENNSIKKKHKNADK